MRRWTTGDAVLTLPACAESMVLDITLGGVVEYVAAASKRAA
jgi:hypothetical protein